jgi:predicted  nucleic acid-binding Zn-ribbon protein
MTLTAIGSYGFLTMAHLQHQVAAQETVNRDAAPLAQRIAIAEAEVRDLDGRIARLVAMVKAATTRGYTKSAMGLVDDHAKSRAELVAERQQAAERLADLGVQQTNVEAQRARVTAEADPARTTRKP